MSRTQTIHKQPQDLRQFAALKAVAEAGSVSGAGRLLAWSDATVNYHLAALEREIGAPLLTRTKRGSVLTPIARELLPGATATLNLAESAIASAKMHAAGAGVLLQFGAFPTAASRLLPRITRRLRKADFKLQAHLHEVAVLNQLQENAVLDAAITYTTENANNSFNTNIRITPVLTDPLLLAVPKTHRFANKTVVTQDDILSLAKENWILGSSQGDPLDDALLHLFHSHQLQPNVRVSTDDYSVALGLVAAGLAVGLIPRLALVNVPAGIALVPTELPAFVRKIVLLTPPQSQLSAQGNTRIETLKQAVIAAAQELPQGY